MADETEKATEQIELAPGQAVSGTVSRIELYGAFVDIGAGRPALLHISQLGKPNVRNVEDELKVGDPVEAFVLKIHETGRIALTMERPPQLPWEEIRNGNVYTGEVVRIENFGVFVEIGAERPGMVHVSELASGFVKSPSDVVSQGDEVEVRVIKVNRKKRQIDLSMKMDVEDYVEETPAEDEAIPTAMALALQRAMEDRDDEGDGKSTRDSKKASEEQDDIISRTLRHHLSNN